MCFYPSVKTAIEKIYLRFITLMLTNLSVLAFLHSVFYLGFRIYKHKVSHLIIDRIDGTHY